MVIKVRRFDENPIIYPEMESSDGSNINGPSLIRVPSWIKNPLGKYYLYFAHHQGQFIRLAYANDLKGPWKIHPPGTLHLKQTACVRHIASPDVHVHHAKRKIYMYFHGVSNSQKLKVQRRRQRTYLATSSDGLTFQARPEILGPFYFRVFEYSGWYYAIAKTVEARGGGVLLRSKDGCSAFELGQNILPQGRHVAVRRVDDVLQIFYTRGEDMPERILYSRMPLSCDWTTWQPTEPTTILEPELDYEGANLPLQPSRFGSIHQPVRQLRDPAIFEEEGKTYLLYAVAGESGIAIAELIFTQ